MTRLAVSPGAEISRLLARGMGQDFHWFPEDVPVSRLAGVLAGMANSSGGQVVLGVAPRSPVIQGVQDVKEAVDHVFQAALLVEPALVLPIPQVIAVKIPPDQHSGELVSINVPPGLPYVYSLDGRYFGRDGFQTNPLPARRLRQLLMERGAVQFESRLPQDASLEDLDKMQVEAYLDRIALPGVEKPEAILSRRGCLQCVNGVMRPTYAGLLLFGKYPQQWLPNAILLAARFPGVAFADQYIKQDICGSLPEQLRQVDNFVHANLHQKARLVGLIRQDAPEYPFEAVRELIVNAVAHRDYNLQGDSIHLHIFADRLEVQSPGGLPGPVTLENLLEARFSRNAVITQVLADLGFVERLGYGLDRVVAVMRQASLPPPRFEMVAGTFRVTLFGNLPGSGGEQLDPDLQGYSSLNLNVRQQLALTYLTRRQRITNSDYQSLCPDVHAETLRRDLVDLVARGIIIKVGDKRATYYILKKVPR